LAEVIAEHVSSPSLRRQPPTQVSMGGSRTTVAPWDAPFDTLVIRSRTATVPIWLGFQSTRARRVATNAFSMDPTPTPIQLYRRIAMIQWKEKEVSSAPELWNRRLAERRQEHHL
jgi:hypothetical protein